MDSLLVTAHLGSPLAGNAPRLDGLLEYLLSLHYAKGVPGYKVDRNFPAPLQGEIPIPLLRRRLGLWLVGVCSDPIYPVSIDDRHEHVAKRIDADNAALLAPEARVKFPVGNSWTKSYRLPLRVRRLDRVCWFAAADRRPLLHTLKQCQALGKKTSIGYGRVTGWEIEETDQHLSWYACIPQGRLLMATLPVGDWLPPDLVGYRHGFGAVAPPYWHRERYTDIVMPC